MIYKVHRNKMIDTKNAERFGTYDKNQWRTLDTRWYMTQNLEKTMRWNTWEESTAGGSRSEIRMETEGPVQLLWANKWRQETARAIRTSSLQQERQDTHSGNRDCSEGCSIKYFEALKIQKKHSVHWQTPITKKVRCQPSRLAGTSLCKQLNGFKNRQTTATSFAAFLLGWEEKDPIMMRGEEEQYVLHSTFTHKKVSPESNKGYVKPSLLKLIIHSI